MRRSVLVFDSALTALVVAGAIAVSLPQPARAADGLTQPPVPDDIHVPDGNRLFLVGHAIGTQNYVCLPSGSGFAWSLFTPEATLFDDHQKQLTTHFFSPSPAENNAIRATWQHSRDTSIVWGKVPVASTDSRFVAEGAVAWLRLEVAKGGAQEGPTGGDTLANTSFIQRLNTEGGLAPATGCSSLAEVGARAFQPYRADYLFYTPDDGT